jgi:hypothetical protein
MELRVEPQQSGQKTVGRLEPSRLWVLGLAADDDALARPRIHEDSYLAECNCPDDCLRDHENE